MGRLSLFLTLFITLSSTTSFAQQATGSIRGQVSDEFGGVIVGATVTAVDAKGIEKSAKTNGDGAFVINGLAAGKYTVRAASEGFAIYENADVTINAGRSAPLNITLKVTIAQQKVTVSENSSSVNTEPESNVGAIVLRGADLDSLPDDPDDLVAALQALAGPSAGPNGGQIFIDGFTGGVMPPLASIREVRINANPFSAEYDRPGFGRIEILTKPGTDKFRGQASFGFNNMAFNARNPFAPTRAPYSSRQYGGNLSGPISKKKASFFFDFDKRDINDDAVINATIVDANLNVIPFSQTVPTPNRRMELSPRIDYQINSRNTLVARYELEHSTNVAGVGGFSLASRQYNTTSTEHNIRLTETAILNKKTVNETRFQFIHQTSSDNANNTIPTIQVSDAFTGGGSQIGLASNIQNRWELTNTTALALGLHSVKFGARLRDVHITSNSPQNFGGTWTFAGSRIPGQPVISSIQDYQITLQGLQNGLTPAQIRAQGGGATQFSISTGSPLATVSQFDFGGFVQDDWKLRPNLTVDLGLRYENQSNIKSNFNFAPRLGFAWAPGPANPRQAAKTVVRGGFGIFYDRVGENLTLNASRFNGTNQQQFIVTDPTVLNSFPAVPSVAILTAFATPITIDRLAPDLRTPYTIQSVISVEHQLAHNFRVSATFSNSRTLHLLRSRAVNAPLPGTFIFGVPGSGVRPFGPANNIFEYESTGRFNQNQFTVNVVNNFSRRGSVTAFYTFAKANSDTDGIGTFAANPYDFSGEYGRASNDVRHRFTLFGNYRGPWGLSFSPLVSISSGSPFNIVIGRDLNGDALFTERPAFANDLTKPGVVITRFGAFDPNPTAGEVIIPRNFGEGPGSISTNLRISKTFGFGKERSTGGSARQQGQRNGGGDRGARGGDGGRGGFGFPGMGGPGGGGPRGGGAGGGNVGFGGGGGQTGKRYNLTFSLNFQNILNHANLGKPNGNLSSPFFGISTGSAGNFGGFGGGRGGGTPPYNRLIDASIRFSF